MKRFLIAMALVVFMAGAASAEGTMFGVKLGINMANLSGDDVEDTEMMMAYGGGIWMNYAFTEAFSLQPELLYMLKGADMTMEFGGEEYEASMNLSYVDINILLKYSVPTEGNFVPYIFAGPYVGMLMSAEVEVEDETEDIKDELKSMDMGAILGAGFDYMLEAGGCLAFDIRYAMGLTTIDDSELESDVKNTGIMVMVGYGFAF